MRPRGGLIMLVVAASCTEVEPPAPKIQSLAMAPLDMCTEVPVFPDRERRVVRRGENPSGCLSDASWRTLLAHYCDPVGSGVSVKAEVSWAGRVETFQVVNRYVHLVYPLDGGTRACIERRLAEWSFEAEKGPCPAHYYFPATIEELNPPSRIDPSGLDWVCADDALAYRRAFETPEPVPRSPSPKR